VGYTHYYTQRDNFTNEEWSAFTSTVEKIVKEYEGTLEEFSFNDTHLVIHDQYWESFVITNVRERRPHLPASLDMDGFGFTKTGQAQYDKVVTASLIALKEIMGDKYQIGSDGSWADWMDGRMLYTMATGKEAVCPFTEEEVEA
jgi:hypothetical protein